MVHINHIRKLSSPDIIIVTEDMAHWIAYRNVFLINANHVNQFPQNFEYHIRIGFASSCIAAFSRRTIRKFFRNIESAIFVLPAQFSIGSSLIDFNKYLFALSISFVLLAFFVIERFKKSIP